VSVQTELLGAIATDPEDPGPQLVLADWLLAGDDPRGELIILDHRDRETPGGLTDPDALDRILLLAAEYGFPCARDEVEPMLPFRYAGAEPLQYRLDHAGHHYYVRYQSHSLSVMIDNGAIDSGVQYGFQSPLGTSEPGSWTEDEARVILTLLGDAIRAGTPLIQLEFPFTRAALPQYDGVPLRGYTLPLLFIETHHLSANRYGLAARDYHRWHALWARLLNARPHYW
jgi:uncharacterized protein (TIGR02996 family)